MLAAPGDPRFEVLGVDGWERWCLLALWPPLLNGMSAEAQLSSAACELAVEV